MTDTKTKKVTSEYAECVAFYRWAQANPVVSDYLIKIPNEGRRNPFSGYCLKLIGLRAGVPDYFLPLANAKYHGLWIEMKACKQSSITTMQKDWIAKLNKIDHHAVIAYGSVDAIRIVTEYLADSV